MVGALILTVFLALHLAVSVDVEVQVQVPSLVRSGSTVTLYCLFDLHGLPLYAVLWYRGTYKFYRYMPRELPPGVAFPIAGLDVDLNGSNAQRVMLRSIPKNMSGPFTCEVTADDEPIFHTALDSANLTVVEMGLKRPQVTAASSVHHLGVPLYVNCSTQPTDPPPHISFYINENKVDDESVRYLSPGIATLIAYNVTNEPGLTWVHCEASVPGVYHEISASIPILTKVLTDSSVQEISRHATATAIFFVVLVNLY